MKVQILREGGKNLSLLAKGFATEDFGPDLLFDLTKLTPPREGWKGLRLDSAAWLIQEKMGLYLWWSAQAREEDLALVMESRNGLRLDEGIPTPRFGEEWAGKMFLSSFRTQDPPCSDRAPKTFILLLEFDKQ